jgi:hypothetical protein
MAVGGLGGGLAGFVVWMLTDAFVFLPAFLGVGLVTGIAFAESRSR